MAINTPGVVIKEVAKLPPSVVGVATAVPAFLGFTEKAIGVIGESLTNKPTRITSLLEYIQYFGTAIAPNLTVIFSQPPGADPLITFDGDPPGVPDKVLYYSVRLYFANGGGPCWIVSLNEAAAGFAAQLNEAFAALEQKDEPTIVLCPDAAVQPQPGGVAAAADDADYVPDEKAFMEKALAHCKKLQDRFMVADVPASYEGLGNQSLKLSALFRNAVPASKDERKYGSAYFPFLETGIPFEIVKQRGDYKKIVVEYEENGGPVQKNLEADDPDDAIPPDGAMYNAVADFLRRHARVTLPPSGAIAGVYAKVDRDRGVFKAPANVSINQVLRPAVGMTNDVNGQLNVDPGTGKSINVIRFFKGKGSLVWGARTLAGNDNEWRYVNVRRFYIYVEESVKKATEPFVFEGNNANTWAKVRSMIESFLVKEWRDGALMGAKPEDAFYVKVGLNQTMSAQDVLEGRMIVEIGMAAVRPAEFIILEFSHMLPTS
jgi:phage tail sheath protein FI